MNDLYHHLKHAYERAKNYPPDCRVRIAKGHLQDEIRFGMFKETLLHHIDETDIRQALRDGLLIKQKITPDGSTVRNVFIWTDHDCKQVSLFKRIYLSIKEWLNLLFHRGD